MEVNSTTILPFASGLPLKIDNPPKANASNSPTTYPNSENIPPPSKKHSIRVLDPATRIAIKLHKMENWHLLNDEMTVSDTKSNNDLSESLKLIESWHEKKDAIEKTITDQRLKNYLEKDVEAGNPVIDILIE